MRLRGVVLLGAGLGGQRLQVLRRGPGGFSQRLQTRVERLRVDARRIGPIEGDHDGATDRGGLTGDDRRLAAQKLDGIEVGQIGGGLVGRQGAAERVGQVLVGRQNRA